jgi:hypothetical protein
MGVGLRVLDAASMHEVVGRHPVGGRGVAGGGAAVGFPRDASLRGRDVRTGLVGDRRALAMSPDITAAANP